MSSPKRANAQVRKASVGTRSKATGTKAVTSKPMVVPAVATNDCSSEAIRLAASIERALSDGRLTVLSTKARQALLAATCKIYAAQVEKGGEASALDARSTVSPTEVMVTASGLLKSVNLAAFELGLWQSWTGR